MDVAEKARMGVNRFWKIENGYAEADDKERESLAKVFGVAITDVFPGPDKQAVA